MKYKFIVLFVAFITICTILGIKLHSYYAPAQQRPPYHTIWHQDDTIRIAYIGDSWAFRHQFHQCKIKEIIENRLRCPVIVSSYGIGGLTSKEIYHAVFELDNLKHFMQNGYDYCFISAGINDTFKKLSTSYYKESINCIIDFLLFNHIHPVILEIPDYNITNAYDNQENNKKLLRRFSMLVNSTSMDCKQDFRNALDDLINEKGYKDKVSVIRYKSWNKDYKNDLKLLYISDGMHLNEKGYEVLDSMIAETVSLHYALKHNLSYNIPK